MENTAQANPKTVLVVDDHPIFSHGVIDLINTEKDLHVCGNAENSLTALGLMRKMNPDAAVVDITMPGPNGVELVKMMKAERPALAILILSMHDESLYALRALRAGALGYVMKAEAATHLIAGIRKVLSGDVYLSSRFSERLIFKSIQAGEGEESPVSKLTSRELEVLELVGKGFGTRDIANQLALSVKTVETHRGHIREKLHFKDTGELVRFAMEWVARSVPV